MRQTRVAICKQEIYLRFKVYRLVIHAAVALELHLVTGDIILERRK